MATLRLRLRTIGLVPLVGATLSAGHSDSTAIAHTSTDADGEAEVEVAQHSRCRIAVGQFHSFAAELPDQPVVDVRELL